MAVVVFFLCSAVASAGTRVNVPAAFKASLGKIKEKHKLPVLLPGSLTLIDTMKVYASLEASSARGYKLDLSAAPDCHEATACFLVGFSAERGGALYGKANVTLARGDKARFEPSSCGASCAPATLDFIHGGILYSIQDSSLQASTAKTTLVKLANDAIAAGPR